MGVPPFPFVWRRADFSQLKQDFLERHYCETLVCLNQTFFRLLKTFTVLTVSQWIEASVHCVHCKLVLLWSNASVLEALLFGFKMWELQNHVHEHSKDSIFFLICMQSVQGYDYVWADPMPFDFCLSRWIWLKCGYRPTFFLFSLKETLESRDYV